jgi:hypothetical protein
MKRLLLVLGICLPVLIFTTFVLNLKTANAEPSYEASGDGVRVVVYSEKCSLPEVMNLAQRATWTEKGKTTEGCAGVHPMGVVLFWFSDRTVVAIPTSQFVRVVGA